MSILIKNAKIVCPGQDYHLSKKDIFINNGIIEKIANRITESATKTIESSQLHVSPGWMDIGSKNGEPGYEHQETLETLSRTAASGGYTAIATFPNTQPVIDNRSAVQYILNSTANHLVQHYPIAALSKNCEGKDITEMIDLRKGGAVAFSDGQKSIQSSGMMMRALDYAKGINGLIIHHPVDMTLAQGNQIHEGLISTELGIKGNPNISELLILERDIQLTRYTGSRLLIYNISAQESVAKLKGLAKENIFASVSYLNLCKTDEALQGFDPQLKAIPPLRSEADRQALISGVNKGTLQVITSNHVPLENDTKKKEFVYASPGAIGLQTCYSALTSLATGLSLDALVSCMAIHPRAILKLPSVEITKGAKAELTLFDPSQEWALNDKTNTSKSKNSPFWDQTLQGCVIGVINGKKTYFNKY